MSEDIEFKGSDKSNLDFVLAIRLPEGLNTLLNWASQKVGVSRGEIVRRALLEYFKTHANELPYDLQTKAIRVVMEDTVQKIKDVKRLKYMVEKASREASFVDKEYPKRTAKIIKYLERMIAQEFKKWYDETAKGWSEEIEKLKGR